MTRINKRCVLQMRQVNRARMRLRLVTPATIRKQIRAGARAWEFRNSRRLSGLGPQSNNRSMLTPKAFAILASVAVPPGFFPASISLT